MADLSNGYTRIANEIQKPGRGCVCPGASGSVLRLLSAHLRMEQKQDRVTNTVISELTGLSDSHVSDAIKLLAARGIILVTSMVMKTVGINTELSAWILDKLKTGKLFPKTGISLPGIGKTFPETVDTQDYNKNNIKDLRLGILKNPETRKLMSFSLVIQKRPMGFSTLQVNLGNS